MADEGEFARKTVVESDGGNMIAMVTLSSVGALGVVMVIMDALTFTEVIKQLISNIRDGIDTMRSLTNPNPPSRI